MFYNNHPTFFIKTEGNYLQIVNILNISKIPGVHLPTKNCLAHSCKEAATRGVQ